MNPTPTPATTGHTKLKRYLNEIWVDRDGNATVFGDLAHQFWNYGKGDYPRRKSGSQGCYIYQIVNNGVRDHFALVAAQSTRELALEYTAPYCVLVCCEAEDTRPSISAMGKKLDAA